MSNFTYTGENHSGEKVTRTVEAVDRYQVYDLARQEGHSVNTIEEARVGFKKYLNTESLNYFLSRVSQDELVMMTRNLGSMLKAGLTVTRALSVIERQSDNPRLKGVIKRINERIHTGDQFYQTLKEFPEVFSDLYIAMIKSGEETGDMALALQTLSMQMERASNLTKKIKGAMIYPAIVMSIMVIIGILMMIFVMPQITSVFDGLNQELPATTLFLISLSNFFANHTMITLLIIVGTVLSVVYFFRSKVGHIVSSWVVPRLPVIGTMAKETNAARTARTLSSLLGSGVDVMQALEITEEVVQNVFYKKILREARNRVEKGTALSEVFVERKDLYPILVGEMILVGEETGQIAIMLNELATFYEVEVERKTKDLSTIIEPLLMVVIGAGVGFFALALIAPIYSISDGLN